VRITIFSLFPGYFEGPFTTGLLVKAIAAGIVEIRVVDIRAHAAGKHRQCDDTPYGGGAGMVLKPEPISAAMRAHPPLSGGLRIYLTPRGVPLRQSLLQQWASLPEIQLLCGRYEGVDQRVVERYIDREVSIGDYVLNGGEGAAAIVVEGVARLLPGVLGSSASLEEESFRSGLLEYPHYTRPAEFEGLRVPDVLLSGDHAAIARWRRAQAERLTRERRPDLLEKPCPD